MSPIDILYLVLLLTISGIGVFRYKNLSKPFKILTFFVIAEFLIGIVNYIYILLYHSNALITNLETIIDFGFYSLIYYHLFKSEILKKTIIIISVAVVMFFFINGLILQPFLKVQPTYLFLIINPLYVIFSLMLFRQLLLYPIKINIVKQSVFWFNTAILFSATTLFVTLELGNYVAKHHVKDFIIYYFWYFVLYVFAILIGYSIVRDNKQIE